MSDWITHGAYVRLKPAWAWIGHAQITGGLLP
jgi:hypothetical protein